MEDENVICEICAPELREGAVTDFRVSLKLDTPRCVVGCKFYPVDIRQESLEYREEFCS